MTSHSSVLVAGLVCLSVAVTVVPMPWLAAGATGESSIGVAGCETSCGGVDIPFPFGMGPDHCMLTPGFRIKCKDVGNGVRKAPFLFNNVEVRNISLDQGKAQVLNHISHYCSESEPGGWASWRFNLSNTPYTFSNTANKFTAVGCQALAYIGNTNENASAMYQTGCVAICFEGKMSLNPCSGMGCCQTDIPKGLQYYQVWFDKRLNDGTGACSFAVLMDSSNLTWTSFSSSSSPSAFNSTHGGMAPVVLDWSIGHDDCKKAVGNPDYACRSIHSSCSDADSGRVGLFSWRYVLANATVAVSLLFDK